MAYSLEQFYKDCRLSLTIDPDGRGQEAVRGYLEELLTHREAVFEALGPKPEPGRCLLHHDDETDMYVYAHVYAKEGGNKAHDHGPCWIIYGNLTGHTDMVEWRRTDDGSAAGQASLEKLKEYRVRAGEAVLFKTGSIHETRHPSGDSILIRVISGDMDRVWRHNFDPERGIVRDRPPRPEREAVG